MSLFKKLKRFEVSKLFVCKIYSADNLHYKSYYGLIGEYISVWNPRFLGIKILYGNKTLIDPIRNISYIREKKIDCFNEHKILYYKKIGNITDIFNPTIIGKKSKISLTKIEELNSILEVEFSRLGK